MKVIKQLLNHTLQFGGESHSGWLPSGATFPQPVSVRNAIVDLKIVEDSPGSFLLICESHNTEDNWDNWFQSAEDAQAAAKELYGIDETDWK